jgi:hypothetical protein
VMHEKTGSEGFRLLASHVSRASWRLMRREPC